MKFNKGFSLFELVLAVAVFSLVAVALSTLLIDANISTKLNLDRTQALFYAKEGMEAVRSIRDNNFDEWNILPDGPYCLSNDNASSTWVFFGTSDLIDNKYTRVVNITASTTASSTRDVSVTVSWSLADSRTVSVVLNSLFTDWINVVNVPSTLGEGLIAHYKLNDNLSDTVVIDSKGNATGTASEQTLYLHSAGATAGTGSGFYFNPNNSDYVNTNLSFNLSTSNQSISMWVKVADTDHNSYVFAGAYDAEAASYFLFMHRADQGGVTLQYDPGGAAYWTTPSAAMSADTWTHLVLIRGAGLALQIYQDGSLITDTTLAAAGGPATLFLGSWAAGLGNYLKGSLDDVRIYNRVLTPDEITQLAAGTEAE